MKIIIDIPEKTNAHIRSDYGHGVKGLRDEDREILCDAIYHCTPYKDRQHGEWIPCSERLPEEYKSYLVTKLDTNPNGSTFTTLAYFYTEETGWDIDGVIAWMPFPKPYQKGRCISSKRVR